MSAKDREPCRIGELAEGVSDVPLPFASSLFSFPTIEQRLSESELLYLSSAFLIRERAASSTDGIGIELTPRQGERVMRKTEILTDAEVRHAKPDKGKFVKRLLDGDGLYLQVTKSKEGFNRGWIFRYEMDGERHDYGIGPLHRYSLAEARRRRVNLRQLIDDGIDPLQEKIEAKKERLAEKAKEVKAKTFEQCARAYYKIHQKQWKNEVYRKQWLSNFVRYVFPKIGGLNVADIDSAHIEEILTPIWERIPDTASKVQSQIKLVFNYAKAGKLRDGDNPAARELVTARLGKPMFDRNHHAALPFDDVPTLIAELHTDKSISALALEFLTLTAARTSEVIGATWDEIDLKKRVWIVPAERMKSGREHRVPLSDRAVEILNGLQHHGKFVFASMTGRPLSNMAMLMLLRRKRPNQTVHGMRSAFRDWASERTSYPDKLAELCLADAVGDETEAAYRRGDGLQKRIRLMQTWADFLAKPRPPKTGDVHDLKAERERRAS
jgi:integrase